MQDMYSQALVFAASKLGGLTSKDGTPYVDHAGRVADRMDTEEERTVALLHDVCEDTETKICELSEEGFPREIVECIDQLTRRNALTYFEYIDDISTNPIASKVKIAEVMDNQDVFRVEKLSFQTYSIKERCSRVIKMLLNAHEDLIPWFQAQYPEKKIVLK